MNKNQPADTPITEEALREKGFTWNEEYKCHYLQIDRYDVDVYWDRVVVDTLGGGVRFSGCRTMQDIEILIRLLGGADE